MSPEAQRIWDETGKSWGGSVQKMTDPYDQQRRVAAVVADMDRIDAEGYPHLEKDEEAGAAYVVLSGKEVVRTIEIAEWVNVDVDADGQAVGVEILTLPSRNRA